MKEYLDIVNEQDEVIGKEERGKVHKEGLLHREVHVWIYNDNGEVLFQHRAKDKDTWPDKLDASAGGHVDLGQTYETSALRELEEEVGIVVGVGDLQFIHRTHTTSHDTQTDTINNAFRAIYAYKYKGEELKIEDGKAYGFEWWKVDSLKELSDSDKDRFIPLMIDDEHIEMFEDFIKR